LPRDRSLFFQATIAEHRREVDLRVRCKNLYFVKNAQKLRIGPHTVPGATSKTIHDPSSDPSVVDENRRIAAKTQTIKDGALAVRQLLGRNVHGDDRVSASIAVIEQKGVVLNAID
jgi:hypothetical protein